MKVDIGATTIEKQTIGLANVSFWEGDTKTVGSMGLAYPILTSEYMGHNESLDYGSANLANDTTLMQNLAKKDATLSSFSIAQDRKTNRAWLAFGGLPPVPTVGKFASAPIRPVSAHVSTKGTENCLLTISR